MKKITALILSIITLAVIICSCGKNTKPIETETDENGEIITTTTTKEQATTKNTSKETTSTTQKNGETTKKSDEFEFPEDHYIDTGYPSNIRYIETPTRVIIPRLEFTYYSKLDDERYYFCFDPLCDHSVQSCPVNIFYCSDECIFSPYTNRLYMERYDTLFSMKFDGSDIRMEISFGDVGSDITKDPVRSSGTYGQISCLQQYDNYLYFVYPTSIKKDNSDSELQSFWSLFRYDLKTKKLENLSENVGYESSYLSAFTLTKNKIIFSDMTENRGVRLFSANLDMTDIKEIDTGKYENLAISQRIYDGEKLYIEHAEYKKSENTGANLTTESYQIIGFDPDTYEITEVSEKSYMLVSDNKTAKGRIEIYAITDEFIYYTIWDSFLIGTLKTKYGEQPTYNFRHTLYRMKKDGSDEQVIFEGLTSKDPKVISYSIGELYLMDGGTKAIAKVMQYQYSTPRIMPDGSEYANWQGSFYASFDIDDNGNFVNMHELALDYDE